MVTLSAVALSHAFVVFSLLNTKNVLYLITSYRNCFSGSSECEVHPIQYFIETNDNYFHRCTQNLTAVGMSAVFVCGIYWSWKKGVTDITKT